jgi:molybdopterin-guanine dinucleotide biosynthesis protein A
VSEDLIETVAKAIYESGKFPFSPAWDDDKIGHTREFCRRDARAALQAVEASGTHVITPVVR